MNLFLPCQIPVLDQLLTHPIGDFGLPLGVLTIIQGPPSTGKKNSQQYIPTWFKNFAFLEMPELFVNLRRSL